MRKQFIVMACMLAGVLTHAQIKGNKIVETRTVNVAGLANLEVELYAKVEIDQNANEVMTITADSNLLDLIDTEIVDGKMILAQKEWIQPSTDIIIKIGMPNLKRVQVGVHETVIINNLTNNDASLTALIGGIIVSGNVNSVGIGAENGIIDAKDLKAKEVILNIWGRGKATVNATEVLDNTLSADARLVLVNQPKKIRGSSVKKAISKADPKKNDAIKYINIKIKNNSLSRNHFVVVGPKPDGNTFSYGFPMMPGATKKERWTTGTKVYKKNKIGRKLLVTLTAANEDTVVKLFD
ncbi:DUF2807 domain-containing protein [Spongiivirga sp. MCCC 1A20706]|uniref:GIN domain-containing protein n=1 Tax=Spongiivirga sp. MCCC 1A20706 TaxID=3160963 RepID=UPI003977949A